MDERVAHPLKRKIRQRHAAARLQTHAWASHPGWRRRALRAWSTVTEFELPRGAGASAAAFLLLASAGYGAVKGEHVPNIVAQVQDIADIAANHLGFRITEIALAGNRELGREEILALAGVTGRSSLLFMDAARTRARLLSDPWIAEATVLKLYPGRLRIELVERKAFALWQKDARLSLIANDGTVLETYVPRRYAALPQVVGTGAEHQAAEFLALLARYPAIANQVDASVLVAERRWNLHLKAGVEVLLPEVEPEQALRMLTDLDRDKKLLSRDIAVVDLRLADRVTVRQSDAAAAARNEAIKALDKSKKKKGSEA